MNPAFEAEEVKVFGEMYKKGYIYKGLKPVYWCPHDETALAEAEIEYQDDPCTTVYVKFPMQRRPGQAGRVRHEPSSSSSSGPPPSGPCPATWPSPCTREESYVLVKADNGETYIMAEALMDKVMDIGGFEHYEIVATPSRRLL